MIRRFQELTAGGYRARQVSPKPDQLCVLKEQGHISQPLCRRSLIAAACLAIVPSCGDVEQVQLNQERPRQDSRTQAEGSPNDLENARRLRKVLSNTPFESSIERPVPSEIRAAQEVGLAVVGTVLSASPGSVVREERTGIIDGAPRTSVDRIHSVELTLDVISASDPAFAAKKLHIRVPVWIGIDTVPASEGEDVETAVANDVPTGGPLLVLVQDPAIVDGTNSNGLLWRTEGLVPVDQGGATSADALPWMPASSADVLKMFAATGSGS